MATFEGLSLLPVGDLAVKSWVTSLIPKVNYPNVNVINNHQDALPWARGLLYAGFGVAFAGAFTKPGYLKTLMVLGGVASFLTGFKKTLEISGHIFSENLQLSKESAKGIPHDIRYEAAKGAFSASLQESFNKIPEAGRYALFSAATLAGYFFLHNAFFENPSNGHFITTILATQATMAGILYCTTQGISKIFPQKLSDALDALHKRQA